MGITIFFPVYNDEHTVNTMVEKSISVLKQLTDDYEVLIVNDGSPDKSGEKADYCASKYPGIVRVIHHEKNLGYGAAVRTGLAKARFDWVCLTDGDDEYDVYDLLKMYKLVEHYPLIITFRYVKMYSSWRQFMSWTYNSIFRFLFKTRFRDISTGLRLLNKKILSDIELKSNSPFIGAELVIKTMLRGHPIGEMGIQTFPRQFGSGSSTTYKNIVSTIKEMLSIYSEIFSNTYQLPENRKRENIKAHAGKTL